MRFASIAAALTGIASVAALQSPHRRAPEKAKRALPIHHEDKHAHHKRQSSYLTSKTASKYTRVRSAENERLYLLMHW